MVTVKNVSYHHCECISQIFTEDNESSVLKSRIASPINSSRSEKFNPHPCEECVYTCVVIHFQIRSQQNRTRACASRYGQAILCPMIDSMAAVDSGLNVAIFLNVGAETLRPKSDHCSMSMTDILRAFVTLSAVSRPPVIYAAPMIASATSAIAYNRKDEGWKPWEIETS
jgi:hypothetical protein